MILPELINGLVGIINLCARYNLTMQPKEFVEAIVKKYENFEGVFENHKNAEDLAPKTDAIAKALFLFYVIQLDYATKSQRLCDGAKLLFQNEHNFYNPDFILELNEVNLKKYLEQYLKPRYINEAIKRYKINSKKLIQKN
jgi:hypothetical protein